MIAVINKIGIDPNIPEYVYTEDNFHAVITRQGKDFSIKYSKPFKGFTACKTAAGVLTDINRKKGLIP